MTIGMTLVELGSESSRRDVKRLVGEAMAQTPAGRQLCVTYPFPGAWEASFPFEAVITRAVLGAPESRVEPHEWLFSGNLAVRSCAVVPDSRLVTQEIGVLIFRRAGEMAYVRRSTAPRAVVDTALLPALHPVFTRDVANNVWHLPTRGLTGAIRRRLQALYTWPDERTLLLTQTGQRSLAWKALELDTELIGVPTKQRYRWNEAQGELFELGQV